MSDIFLACSDAALPSPSPESALPSLGDVMDAVKAAFMEAVKISEDDAVRAVFEQVVEELGPQKNISEEPPATADDSEDGLPAVVHEHADKETTHLSEENANKKQTDLKLESPEQTIGLSDKQEVRQSAGLLQEPDEEPVELIYRLNKSAEEPVQEVKDPVQNVAGDLVELTQEPNESFELESKDFIDQAHAEQDESHVWSFELAAQGVQEEREESELVKVQEQTQDTDGNEEIEREVGWKEDMEVELQSKIQKGELLDLAKPTQPQNQDGGLVTDDDSTMIIVDDEKQNEDEPGLGDVRAGVLEVKTEKKNMVGDAAAHIDEEVKSLIPVSKATEKTSHEPGN